MNRLHVRGAGHRGRGTLAQGVTPRRSAAGPVELRHYAAALSAYAALLHNRVLPEHFMEWWGYGAFFLVVAAVQGFYSGLLLLWPQRWVFRVGVAGNGAILALYVVTRTVGVPFFGPAAGEIETVGHFDLATAIAEVALLLLLVKLLRDFSPGSGDRTRPSRQ